MKNAMERIRVAILWHDTLVEEVTPRAGAPVTLGADPKNVLMTPDLPAVGASHTLLEHALGAGYTLNLTPQMLEGTLHLDDQPLSLGEARAKHGAQIPLQAPQRGTIDLGEMAVFFQVFEGEEVAPRRPFWAQSERSMLGALLAALVLHFGLLITAFVLWDAQANLVKVEDILDRFSKVLQLEIPVEEEPEPEPESDEAPSKKAGGEEGEFGEPDKPEETITAKREGHLAEKIRDVGVHKALSSSLMGSGALSDVFGNQEQFSDSLSMAMAGGDGPLIMGRGLGGMGLRGTGSGGGGDGFGKIHGMGRIEGGGSGRGVKSKLKGRKQRKKKVNIKRLRPGMSGFCKEKDIIRVVNARQGGIQYCYEKELARNPELAGKITLSWRIKLDGGVQKVIIEGSTINNIEVEGCIKRNIQRWRFPKPEGGMCQIRFPFIFNAGL